MPKEKRLNLNKLKGWKSYVYGYEKYTEKFDDVDWNGKGTKQPKKVEDLGNGRTRITF